MKRLWLFALIGISACGRVGLFPSGSSTDGGGGLARTHPGSSDGGSVGARTLDLPRPVCGEWIDPQAHARCATLDWLALSDPQWHGIRSTGTNAGAIPGEEASIDVLLTNSGPSFVDSPCLGVIADSPAVSVVGPNPYWSLYGVGAGASASASVFVMLDTSVPHGTTIHVSVWADLLNADCTNGREIAFEVRVQ